MGLSWLSREQIRYCPKTGAILNPQLDDYAIASPMTIPKEFRVELLSNVRAGNAFFFETVF